MFTRWTYREHFLPVRKLVKAFLHYGDFQEAYPVWLSYKLTYSCENQTYSYAKQFERQLTRIRCVTRKQSAL